MSEKNMTANFTPKQEQSTFDEKVSEPGSATTEIRSRVPAVAWTLVIVFSIAFAGYFTLPMWRGELPKYMQNQLAGGSGAVAVTESRLPSELISLQNQNDLLKKTVADLEKSVEASRARLTAIDKILVRQSAGEKSLEELRAEVKSVTKTYAPFIDAQLLGRIDALEKSISGTVSTQSGQAFSGRKLDESVAALTTRMDTLEAAVIKLKKALRVSISGGSLALAAGQLRDALSRAGPFEAEIATLKRLAGDNADVVAAIASIENMAAKGVPSRVALLSRLPAIVDKIVAATRAPKDGDWVERTVSKLRGFVIVRRVDGKGEDTDSVVARAEAAADRGDLSVATSEIAKLNKNAGDEVKVWLENARARLAVEKARAALNRFVLNELAASD